MRRLKIAIDARPLSQPMVGITRYTYEVVKRLVHTPHEWFLYLDAPPIHPLPNLSNVHIRHGDVGGAFMSTFFAQWQFPSWAKQDQIDVFWSPRHHLPLCLGKNVKRLLTVHDMVWLKHPETMVRMGWLAERALMPPSISSADCIACVSSSTARDLTSYSECSAPKVHVVYPGFARSTFQISSGLNARSYFLFVGTLEPRKNLELLLKAYSLIAEPIQLVIVGGLGWGELSIEDEIKRLNLTNRVRVVGRVTDEELVGYYGRARALVMPSLFEGFGLPLLESMSFGVPVVTSNLGAMKEVAGDAGVLVDPHSVEDIASGLRQILDDQLWEMLSRRALVRSRQFTWERCSAELLGLIRGLVD